MGLTSFRYRIIALICVILVLWQSAKHSPPLFQLNDDSAQSAAVQPDLKPEAQISKGIKQEIQKVLISVYYEALCPDSRSFILVQLLPTFQKIAQNVQVELVPYGKATTSETANGYEFHCQHGPLECQANIIHACVIDLVIDPSVQLQYIACMIQDNIQPVVAMNRCATKLEIDVGPIEQCSSKPKGKELLAKFGEMTDDLIPKITFIPTITLDKDSGNQLEILKDLLKQVCLLFDEPPSNCPQM